MDKPRMQRHPRGKGAWCADQAYDGLEVTVLANRREQGIYLLHERYGSMHHDTRQCLLLCRQASLNQRDNRHGGKHDYSKDEVETAPSHVFQ
jgi:hypothetical protein